MTLTLCSQLGQLSSSVFSYLSVPPCKVNYKAKESPFGVSLLEDSIVSVPAFSEFLVRLCCWKVRNCEEGRQGMTQRRIL